MQVLSVAVIALDVLGCRFRVQVLGFGFRANPYIRPIVTSFYPPDKQMEPGNGSLVDYSPFKKWIHGLPC